MTNFSFVKGPFSGIRRLKSHYKPRPDAVLVRSPSRNHSTKSGRNQWVCPQRGWQLSLALRHETLRSCPGKRLSAPRGCRDYFLPARLSREPGHPRPSARWPRRAAGPRRPWQHSVPRRLSLPTSERRTAPRPLRFVNTVEYLTFTITCKYSGRFVYETLFFFFFYP